jgi:hypothetical protein
VKLGSKHILLSLLLLCLAYVIHAQDNYEIQVYASETVPKGFTMCELHSNYTLQGFKDTLGGVLPTHHAIHETIEITHGFTSWFEVGFYQFTAFNSGMGPAYVGNHIRPRVRVPDKYNYKVGLSLSAEVGYQVPNYATDSWTLELRPIIDKTAGKWYFALNPVVDYAFTGPDHSRGAFFSPNAKFSFAFTKVIQAGLEYYNTSGPFNRFDAFNNQPHQLALAFDFNFSPEWELNVGYVKGFTPTVEHDIFKIILGKRFGHAK